MEWRGIFFTGLIFLFFKFTVLQAGNIKKDPKEVIQESQQESLFPFEIWRMIFQHIHPLEWTRMSQVNSLFYKVILSLVMTENELECICLEKNSLRLEYLQWQALKKVFMLLFDQLYKPEFPINVEPLEREKLSEVQFVFQENSFAFFVQKSVMDYLKNLRNSKNFIEDWKAQIEEKDLSIAQMDILSICYRYGIGVRKDKNKAIEYEKKVMEEYRRHQIGKFPFFFMDRIRCCLKKRLGGNVPLKEELHFTKICMHSKSMNLIQFAKEWAHLESNWIKNLIYQSSINFEAKLELVGNCLKLGVNSITIVTWLNEEYQKLLELKFSNTETLGSEGLLYVSMKYIQSYIQLKKNLKFQYNKNLDLKMQVVCSKLNSDQFLKNFSNVFINFEKFFDIFNPDLRQDLLRLQLAQLYMELKKDLEAHFDPTLFENFFEINPKIQKWLDFKQEKVIKDCLSSFNQEILEYLNKNFGLSDDSDYVIFKTLFQLCFQSGAKLLKNEAEEWMKNILSSEVSFIAKLKIAYQYWKIFGDGEVIFENWDIQHQKELEKLIKSDGFFPNDSHPGFSQEDQYQLIHFCSFLGNAAEKMIEQLKALDRSSKIYKNSEDRENRINHFLLKLKAIMYFLNQDVLPNQLRRYGEKWLLSEQTYLHLREVFEDGKVSDIEQLALLYSRIL